MLPAIITQLEQLISQVKASGPVAAEKARLDISTHATSGHDYARLRTGSQLKSCGRVGSEQYVEVLATIHRRDAIAQLTQAIAALKRADAIPVVIPTVGKMAVMAKPGRANATTAAEMATPAIANASASNLTAPAAKSNPKSASVARKTKTKRRKQLYTHVKTKQGSVVHAVLGKDNIGEWRTPALCGATPPQRDRMGWEFPVHDDGVSCAKCYRKLPANGKRHFPDFG
ncbi:MAG: hypothetical protein AAFV46_08865 [Cyanobacteria bacterium J06635_11]